MKHFLIYSHQLDMLPSLLEKRHKPDKHQLITIEGKYILPQSFHPKLWVHNWNRVTDILQNGDVYGERLLLIFNSTEELNNLYPEQQKLIQKHCLFLS